MAVQTLRPQHVLNKKIVQNYGNGSKGEEGKEGESRGIWLYSFLIRLKLFKDTMLNPDPQSGDQHLFWKKNKKTLVSISKYQREMLCFDLKQAYEPTRAVWFAIIKL